MPTFQELYPQFYTDEYQTNGPLPPPDPNPSPSPISAFSTLGDLAQRPSPAAPQAPPEGRPTYAQRFHAILAGQNPYDTQSVIHTRRQEAELRLAQRDDLNAKTEMLFNEKLMETDPKYRPVISSGIKRWYKSRGIDVAPEWTSFWNKADKEDLELAQMQAQAATAHLSPEEKRKWQEQTLSNPVAVVKFHAELAKSQETRAKAAEHQAEADILSGVASRVNRRNEPPGSSGSPSNSPGSAIPQPMPGTQPGASQGAQMRPAAMPQYLSTPEGRQVQNYVLQLAKARGIDPAYAQALIHQESGWDPNAVSPTGVTGLAQVTNATGRPYGQTPQSRTNPYVSAGVGLSHFGDLLKQTGGNYQEALRRYGDPKNPQYVQQVERHVPLYGGTVKPHTPAVAQGANTQEAAALRNFRTRIDQIDAEIEDLGPASMNEKVNRRVQSLLAQKKGLLDQMQQIEKRYEGNPSQEVRDAAEELFPGVPWVNLDPPKRGAVMAYVEERTNRMAGSKAGAIAAAEQPYKISAAKAGRQGQDITDVNMYQDAEGNPPPVGWDRGDLKTANDAARQATGKDKYVQVDKLPDKQEDKLAGFATSYELAGQLIADLEDPAKLKALEPVIGSIVSNPKAWYDRAVAGRIKGLTPQQQEFSAKLAFQMIQLRKEFLGTAQSAAELSAAQPFLTSLEDAKSGTILAKLKALRAFAKVSHDTVRRTAVGLKQRVPPALPADETTTGETTTPEETAPPAPSAALSRAKGLLKRGAQ